MRTCKNKENKLPTDLCDIKQCKECKNFDDDFKNMKKELNLSHADIAEFFGMSYGSLANSTAKQRYFKALLSFYAKTKKHVRKSCCDQTKDINKIMKLKFKTCRDCKKEL